MHLEYPQKANGMYILRKDDFDVIATKVLNKYQPHVLEHPCPVDIMDLAEEQYGLMIENRHITANSSILGIIAMGEISVPLYDTMFRPTEEKLDEGTVIIDSSLLGHEQRPRYKFTIAHETSHWMLHRTYHSPTNQQYQLRTNNIPKLIACRSTVIESTRATRDFKTDSDWEEWQADSLAAALLMPKANFYWAALEAFRLAGVRGNYLYITGNNCADYHTINAIVREIAKTYAVSQRAAKIRLEHLGYFRKETKYAC